MTGGIEGVQLVEVNAFDVAADAPFGEAQRHPRLEPRQITRVHVRMGGEEVI